MKKLRPIALLAVLMLVVIPTIVQADPWSAIDSGYAITTNYHGVELDITSPPTNLKAKVGVLTEKFVSLGISEVRVDLRDPDGNVVDTDTVTLFSDGTSPKGAAIKWGETDPLAPTTWVVGDYSVKAYFYADADDVVEIAHTEDLVAMRATTVMVIPEVAIGTLTILLTMLASLAIFARKKEKF